MALVGNDGLLYGGDLGSSDPGGGAHSGELGAALAGLSFGGVPPPPQQAALDAGSAPIAIPGGLRPGRPGGMMPGPFIPVDTAAATAGHATAVRIASSPGTSELSTAFAAACEVGSAPGAAGSAPHGPLGVPTGASASAGAPPLLAGIDEEEDVDLAFLEDDDDLLRALDTAPPGGGRGAPPPPGGSQLWAEYGASAPPAPACFDSFFPASVGGGGAGGAGYGGGGPAAPARHPATVGFAASPASLHAHETAGGMPIPVGGLTRSFAAAGGHGGGGGYPTPGGVAGSAQSDFDHLAWPGAGGGGAAASMPVGVGAGAPQAMLSPAHARAGGAGPPFHRAPSAPALGGLPGWHPSTIRGFAVVGTPPVGTGGGGGGGGGGGFLHVGSVGTSGAPLASSLSGSLGRGPGSASRSGLAGSHGGGRPLSATSPALKHSASAGALARAAATASRSGRLSRPPRRPLDDDDGSFESGSFGAGGSGSGGGVSGSIGGRGSGGGRKHHNPWSVEETEALVAGVEACGGGKWADIKKLGWPSIDGRSAVDLKDKWRNLTRLVSLPSALPRAVARCAGEPGGEKRRLPPELLERVRALMPADPDLPYGRITASRAARGPVPGPETVRDTVPCIIYTPPCP